jgi:hypothetical protein
MAFAACFDLDRLDAETDGGPSRFVPTEAGVEADPVETVDGGDAAAPTVPSLANGGFEVAGPACGPGWTQFQATLTRVTPGRSGQYACMLCNTLSTNAYLYIYASLSTNGDAGRWYGEAYFRAAPDAGDASITADFRLSYNLPDGGGNFASTVRPKVSAMSGWVPAQTNQSVPSAASKVYVNVGVDGPPGSCVVVDDVVLVQQ